MRQEIKKAAANGMPILAECGGLMYLGKVIRDRENKDHICAGVFPWTTRMLRKRKALSATGRSWLARVAPCCLKAA